MGDCRFETADCRLKTIPGAALGGFSRRDHDGGKLIGFVEERVHFGFWQEGSFDDQLQPVAAFICFFDDNLQFRYEFRLRSTSTGRSIVGSHGCRTSKKLCPNCLPNSVRR